MQTFEITIVDPDGQGFQSFTTALPQIDHSYIHNGKAFKVYDVIHYQQNSFTKAFIMLMNVPANNGKATVNMIRKIENGG